MKLRYKHQLAVLFTLCLMVSVCHACFNLPPIPVVWPEEEIVCVDAYGSFGGASSHDQDEAGEYIFTYEWWLYDYQTYSYVNFYTGDYYSYMAAYCFDTPGRYAVDLYVEEDEATWSTSYDTCEVTVVRVTVDSPAYMGYKSSVEIDYMIEPEEIWDPDYVNLNIYYGATLIRTIPLAASSGSHWTTWDGKASEGTWAPAATYTVEVEVGTENPDHECYGSDVVTIVDVNLAASDLFGEVAEDDEDLPNGAFIHFNLDNDDSSDNTQEAPKRPGADYAQNGTTPVTGENDLKLIELSMAPPLFEGSIVLSNMTLGKLWKSTTKGSANLLLGPGGELSWNLANSQQRDQFWQLCTNPPYMEGASSTGGSVSLVYYSPTSEQVKADCAYYHFIAADCGSQPRTTGSLSERDWFEGAFPNLVRCEWSITAEASAVYNCIAWSVVETNVWYVTVESARLHSYDIVIDAPPWGDGNGTLSTTELDAFYSSKNYVPSSTQPPSEPPAEVAVIYYSEDHAAHRMGCTCGAGKWIMFESKCGEGPKIEHVWNQINGASYGSPSRYYRVP